MLIRPGKWDAELRTSTILPDLSPRSAVPGHTFLARHRVVSFQCHGADGVLDRVAAVVELGVSSFPTIPVRLRSGPAREGRCRRRWGCVREPLSKSRFVAPAQAGAQCFKGAGSQLSLGRRLVQTFPGKLATNNARNRVCFISICAGTMAHECRLFWPLELATGTFRELELSPSPLRSWQGTSPSASQSLTTNSRISVMSSIAKRTPSRPRPESLTPP
jgi:hypothetical protein